MAGLPPLPPYDDTSPFFLFDPPFHNCGLQDMDMCTLSRVQQRRSSVRFTDAHTEYPVFRNDPPVMVPGRYQPPETPLISARELPGTPILGHCAVEQDDELMEEGPELSADRSGACTLKSMDGYGAAVPTATPSSLPVHHDARLAKSSPSPSPSPSSSSSPEPAAHSDLSPHLRRFQPKWNVRKKRLADLSPAESLSAHAFESRKKSCTVHFIPPDRSADANAWSTVVGPHRDHRPLSVRDVVEAIDRELYEEVEETGLGSSNVRYESACRERPFRLLGPADAAVNVFRNVDFYPESYRYFHGIEEGPTSDGVGYVVRLGQSRLM